MYLFTESFTGVVGVVEFNSINTIGMQLVVRYIFSGEFIRP